MTNAANNPNPATRRPEPEVEGCIGTAMPFQYAKHARRYDGVRGIQIAVGHDPENASLTFMDYTGAVRLLEGLQKALAFLDAEGETA